MGPEQQNLQDELLNGNYDLTFVAGGAAMNTIRMLQWIVNDPRELQCYCLGSVGQDAGAECLRDLMKKTGVITHYQVQKNSSTGICMALVNRSNRSLVTSLGAAAEFTPEFLLENKSWKMVETAKIYYLSGYFVAISMNSVEILLEHIQSTSKILCLNLASPFVSRLHFKKIDTIIPYADFIFGTMDEAQAFAEAKNLDDCTAIGAAKYAATLPKSLGSNRNRLIILTDGPRSIMTVSSKDLKFRTFNVDPIPSEEFVDTNGAGDGFAAGFLASYLVEKDLDKAIQNGKKAAAYIISRSGFSLDERENF
nr:adenosine kinase [Hymenolepis microstoma]